MIRTLHTGLIFHRGGADAIGGGPGAIRAALASIAFALCFLCVPWQQLRGVAFYDRLVYIEHFLYALPIADEKEISGFSAFLVNEVLWDMLVRGLIAHLALSVETIFVGITFLCLFCFGYFIARRHGPLSMLLLVNPLVVDFAMSQLRMALAISVIMLAFFSGRRLLVAAAAVLACFIHTAIVLFVGMYLVAAQAGKWARRMRLPPPTPGYIAMAGGLLVALLIGPLREAVLTGVGDRRTEYEMAAATLSYASFWILLLAAVPLQRRVFYDDDVNLLAVACLSAFVFSTLIGVFGARFISATMPLLLCATLAFGRPLRELAVLAYLFFMALQWIYWLS
jgi:hypothetical protein